MLEETTRIYASIPINVCRLVTELVIDRMFSTLFAILTFPNT